MSKYTEVILAAVTKLQRHPTAEQVFMAMKKDHPNIALPIVISITQGFTSILRAKS